LNCHLQDLLLPLGACEHVGTIKAVKSGLTGELPNLDPMPPTIVETGIFLAQRSSLASSLEFIDLSGRKQVFADDWSYRFLQGHSKFIRFVALELNLS